MEQYNDKDEKQQERDLGDGNINSDAPDPAVGGMPGIHHPIPRRMSQKEQSDIQKIREQLERSQMVPTIEERLTEARNNIRMNAGSNASPEDARRGEGTDTGNTSGTQSPDLQRSSQRARRKVQWVGLSDSDGPGAAPTGHSHPDHVALPIGSASLAEPSGFNWNDAQGGYETGSDGMQTPGGLSSGGATPETSRPGTPEEGLNIPPGEQDGLPLPSAKRGRTFTREAAKLVAMHKAKSFFRGRRSGRSSPASTSPVRGKGRIQSQSTHKGALYDDDPPPGRDRPVQGAGVLSALLKLYEQPQSAYSSSATLVPSRSSSPAPESPTTSTHRNGSHDNSESTHRAPDVLDSPPTFSKRNRPSSTSQLSSLIRGAADRITDDRPAAAKNKAGVFGALQASALSLATAATPAGSTISPAPERPGYRLNRHSLPEVPTRNTLSPPNSSPGSSRAASPTPSQSRRPSIHQRKTGASLTLGPIAKASQHLAKSSEALAKEHLAPSKYYRESSVYKAQKSSGGSGPGTPKIEYMEEKKGPAVHHRRKKDKRRQEEIFITMHVAAILQRQDFIMRLARALMMFGAPSHRLEAQLQQTAKVLEINCQIIFIVNFMIISFSDVDTHTSEIKFIKQAAGLDLGKLTDIAILHWEVMHDKIGVEEASIEISNLMKSKPYYNNWWLTLIGAWCSAMISIAAFNASLIDLLIAAPLGAFLTFVQCFLASRSDVLSSIFEIVIAAIISFVAAGLSSTGYFCYAAIVSASIVLILPGWPTCVSALELQSRSIVSGSVRLVYAVVYSLFLGFGISLGANIWVLVSGQDVFTSNDNTCSLSHRPGVWWQETIPQWFFFLAVPGFPLGLALRNGARWNKELMVMILIAGAGWNANRWSTYGFPGRADISAALGALTVGLLGNIYGKFFQSTSFIVSCVPILFQLPSGLGNGGLLNWATTNADQQAVFQSGWSVAQQLITVVIGLAVGLLVSCAIIYPFGKRRGGLMTF